jgi:Protein of unknown function (DUF1194)
MKIAKVPFRGLPKNSSTLLVTLIGVSSLLYVNKASAVAVDTELVLIIDVSTTGLTNSQYTTLMNSYASAWSSSQVLNSIQAGTRGKIAVEMYFYGNNGTALTPVVPWTLITNSTQANSFASTFTNFALNRPAAGTFNYGQAVASGTINIGTETGYAANGYESLKQVIQVTGATTPTTNGSSTVPQATGLVLGAGVDVINATLVGNNAAALQAYYQTNVVGGSVNGQAGTATVAGTTSAAITASLTATLVNDILPGGAVVVPEVSPFAMVLSAFGCFAILRRNRA